MTNQLRTLEEILHDGIKGDLTWEEVCPLVEAPEFEPTRTARLPLQRMPIEAMPRLDTNDFQGGA